ncbi:MAG: ribbon-helix-helix domain-containing protein [Promethearchaeota archaeon]
MPKGWTSVSLPDDLLYLIDKLFENNEYVNKLFKNRAAFIIDAIRRHIDNYVRRGTQLTKDD